MKLSEDFVKRGMEKAKGAVIYGVPIEEMTRDELIACVVAGFSLAETERNEAARRAEFLLS